MNVQEAIKKMGLCLDEVSAEHNFGLTSGSGSRFEIPIRSQELGCVLAKIVISQEGYYPFENCGRRYRIDDSAMSKVPGWRLKDFFASRQAIDGVSQTMALRALHAFAEERAKAMCSQTQAPV